jgi:hypothetical protein
MLKLISAEKRIAGTLLWNARRSLPFGTPGRGRCHLQLDLTVAQLRVLVKIMEAALPEEAPE